MILWFVIIDQASGFVLISEMLQSYRKPLLVFISFHLFPSDCVKSIRAEPEPASVFLLVQLPDDEDTSCFHLISLIQPQASTPEQEIGLGASQQKASQFPKCTLRMEELWARMDRCFQECPPSLFCTHDVKKTTHSRNIWTVSAAGQTNVHDINESILMSVCFIPQSELNNKRCLSSEEWLELFLSSSWTLFSYSEVIKQM